MGKFSTGERKAKKLKELIKRQKGLCGICGKPVTAANSNIDHIVPKSRGGSGLDFNLRAAHKECNSDKANAIEDSPEYRDAVILHERLGIFIDSDDRKPRWAPYWSVGDGGQRDD